MENIKKTECNEMQKFSENRNVSKVSLILSEIQRNFYVVTSESFILAHTQNESYLC